MILCLGGLRKGKDGKYFFSVGPHGDEKQLDGEAGRETEQQP